MKRMIIVLCVLPFASQAMENTIIVQLRGGNEHMSVSMPLVNKDSHETMTKKMQQFVCWFDHTPFISHLLEEYRDCLLLAAKHEKADIKELIKAKINNLRAQQEEQQKNNESTENKKLTTQQLAAAHCVSAFMALEELK